MDVAKASRRQQHAEHGTVRRDQNDNAIRATALMTSGKHSFLSRKGAEGTVPDHPVWRRKVDDGRTKNSGGRGGTCNLGHEARLKKLLSASNKVFHFVKYSVVENSLNN